MKVTGYRLQYEIKEAKHERDVAAVLFTDGLWQFKDENKPKPPMAMKVYRQAENRIVALQEAQAKYNLAVMVEVQGQKMSLCRAIKAVGGAGRIEQMWREIAKSSQARVDAFGIPARVRDADAEQAEQTISAQEAAGLAKEAGRYASALRQAIQVGNATEVDIELAPSVLSG